MSETEIIKRILAEMNQGQHYRFFDIWSRVTGNPIGGEVWRKERKAIFTLMINKGFIRHIRNDDYEAIVELSTTGINIKEGGALKFDFENIKVNFWTLGKKLFLWLTLGGLATWLLVWDRWIDPIFNNKTTQQQEVIIPDTSSQAMPTEVQIVQDSSKADITKPDSLDGN